MPVIYAAFPVFERDDRTGRCLGMLRVKTRGERPELVAGVLEQALLDARLTPSFVNTRGEFRASLEEHFAVVSGVMKMIALASALIGAITLIATVSLGVLERAREIGVIRALGRKTARSRFSFSRRRRSGRLSERGPFGGRRNCLRAIAQRHGGAPAPARRRPALYFPGGPRSCFSAECSLSSPGSGSRSAGSCASPFARLSPTSNRGCESD